MPLPGRIKFALSLVALVAIAIFAISCGGSKANARKDEASVTPKIVEVTTAAAIKRDLPQFFQARGRSGGESANGVSPTTLGKVVAIGVDIGTPVRRGQML